MITPAVTELFRDLEHGALAVTSTRRLARQVEQRYGAWRMAGGATAWPTPHVRAYEDWLGELWAAALAQQPGAPLLLSNEQELALWEQVIGRLAGTGDRPFILQLPAAARTARQTWQRTHDWHLEWRRLREYRSADTEAFLSWAGEVRERLDDSRWLTSAGLPLCLVDQPDAWLERVPATVWWMGFDVITPARQGIMDLLRDHGLGCKRYRNAGAANVDVTLVPCADVGEQWTRVARWARSMLKHDPKARLGVVCPDLGRYRDEVEDILDDLLHPELAWHPDAPRTYHLSLGRPLRDYPVVGSALDLLQWTARKIPFEIVSRTLRSPYVGDGVAGLGPRMEFELKLRDKQQELFTASYLGVLARERRGLKDFAGRLAAVAEIRLPESTDPGSWAGIFDGWLRAFGWPGDRTLDSREYQTVNAWQEQLAGFAGLGAVRGRWSRNDALRKLSSLSAARTLQFHDEEAPVQILGVQEAAGLWFDSLWLTDMSDTEWPPAARPDPFIPIALQKESGMPEASAQSVLKRTRARSVDLLASAGRVRVSFPREVDGAPVVVSPLFREQRLDDEPGAMGFKGRIDQLAGTAARLELVEDHLAPPVMDRQLRGGVGLVGDQARCPFRALAHHRLNVRELADVAPGLSPMTRGSLVHHALRLIWDRLRDRATLKATGEDELRSVVDDCAARALESQFADSTFKDRLLGIERRRLTGLLLEWLVLETQREEFRVVGTEIEAQVELGGAELHLRVDRIDELDRGRLIIDYKTGRLPNVSQWTDPRMDEPQLPLYAVGVNAGVTALALAGLRPGACELRGIADGSAGLKSLERVEELGFDSMEVLKRRWTATLGALVEEHRRGIARVDPRDAKTCRLCDVVSLCRIFERAEVTDER